VADKTGRFLRVRGGAVFDERLVVLERAFKTLPLLKATGHALATVYLQDREAEVADLKGHFEQFTV
jgi:uncharacterized pyridoxamine 5'-phosphate oxidase family protein